MWWGWWGGTRQSSGYCVYSFQSRLKCFAWEGRLEGKGGAAEGWGVQETRGGQTGLRAEEIGSGVERRCRDQGGNFFFWCGRRRSVKPLACRRRHSLSPLNAEIYERRADVPPTSLSCSTALSQGLPSCLPVVPTNFTESKCLRTARIRCSRSRDVSYSTSCACVISQWSCSIRDVHAGRCTCLHPPKWLESVRPRALNEPLVALFGLILWTR